MPDALVSILIGTLGLTVIAVVSLVLTQLRALHTDEQQTRSLQRLVLIGIAIHTAHTGEELYGGFYEAFPLLFGLAPWPVWFFVSFNAAWIVIWLVSAYAIRWRLAAFPIWFLALASAVNGVAHPAMSMVAGGYFPGLFTSPIAGLFGIILTRTLYTSSKRI